MASSDALAFLPVPSSCCCSMRRVPVARRWCFRGSALSQVFVYKQIRRYLLTHLYLWAVVSLFLAIRVSEISTLTGNRSADLFTRGFLAVGVLLLVFVLAGRMGTVRIQTLLLALGGSLFVVAAFFEHRRVASNEKGLTLDLFYSGLCALFGWTAVVVTKSTMLFDMAKSMPTGTRAFCLGLCVAVGSLAEILAPTGIHPGRPAAFLPANGRLRRAGPDSGRP
ncbi:uncharacterized protein LOC142795173 [Rhipicephalus microplus]|uniref:uncharacterized protein LOC142795173 n=1 Tax=Rhipicephalus microplus TaxID=6941 RepID=UPI003F6D40EE